MFILKGGEGNSILLGMEVGKVQLAVCKSGPEQAFVILKVPLPDMRCPATPATYGNPVHLWPPSASVGRTDLPVGMLA
jgi:hypothetical protein